MRDGALTGRHTASIGGGLTLEEVQADGIMRWRDSHFCRVRRQEKGVEVTRCVSFVGVEVETSKTLPSKYC